MEVISEDYFGHPVPRIGFGCCPMGQHGWGRVEENELTNAVHLALDLGISFFDTADIYGLGKSEDTLGNALKNKRSEAFISTKFGVKCQSGRTTYDNSKEWINIALGNSLKRLRTDYIDLYQLHYWDNETPIEDIIESLIDLRTAGKIRNFGVSNLNLDRYKIPKTPGLASFSYEYSLANREHEKIIAQNQTSNELAFLSWGSLGQGILSGKYTKEILSELPNDDRRKRSTYSNFHGAKLERNLELVDEMRRFSSCYPNKSLSQIAIRWILDKLPNSIALVGIKKVKQLEEASGCLGWNLEKSHFELLDSKSASQS